MTKTLTEQYYDGTLPSGFYYFNNGNATYTVVHYQTESYLCANGITVVDKVPSYDEYQDLIQQNVNQESAIETYIERIHELEEQIPNGTWYTEKSHNELLHKIDELEKRLVSNTDESEATFKNCTIELTKQQRFVLYLLANNGMSNADIARELKVKEPTVKMHIKELFKKTGTNSRLSLVVWYYKTVYAIRYWQNVKIVELKGKVK